MTWASAGSAPHPTSLIRVITRADPAQEISRRLIEQRRGLTCLGGGVRMLQVPKEVLRDPGRAATPVALRILTPSEPAWHITTRSKGISTSTWESRCTANIAISVATMGRDGPVSTAKSQGKGTGKASRVAMGILGLNAHTEEEEGQQPPQKRCAQASRRGTTAPCSHIRNTCGINYNVFPPAAPTYVLVVVTAESHADISHPPNPRATHALRAGERQRMGIAGRFWKISPETFSPHKMYVPPKSFFSAFSSPKAARQTTEWSGRCWLMLCFGTI